MWAVFSNVFPPRWTSQSQENQEVISVRIYLLCVPDMFLCWQHTNAPLCAPSGSSLNPRLMKQLGNRQHYSSHRRWLTSRTLTSASLHKQGKLTEVTQTVWEKNNDKQRTTTHAVVSSHTFPHVRVWLSDYKTPRLHNSSSKRNTNTLPTIMLNIYGKQ